MRHRPQGSWKISKITTALIPADESALLDERNETDQFHFVFVRIGWRRPMWDRTAAGTLKSLVRENYAGLC